MIKLYSLLFEDSRADPLRQYYGSNFLHTLKQYTKLDSQGLAMYAVHFSDHNKWGINPKTRYFPVGVYFYYMSPDARGKAEGRGFATDRQWANIARINNNRMVILKAGHPRNFSEQDYREASLKLSAMPAAAKKAAPSKYDTKDIEHVKRRFNIPSNPWFAALASDLYELNGGAGWNRLLHEVGYDGIVDYDGIFLPIESDQGVQTWPGGATYVLSVPTSATGAPRPEQRIQTIYKRLQHTQPGTLKLTENELDEILKMVPSDLEDARAAKSDVFGYLLRAIDFNNTSLWNHHRVEEYAHLFYDDLERNPTTPKSFWQQLVHSVDIGARLTAKDMLAQP